MTLLISIIPVWFFGPINSFFCSRVRFIYKTPSNTISPKICHIILAIRLAPCSSFLFFVENVRNQKFPSFVIEPCPVRECVRCQASLLIHCCSAFCGVFAFCFFCCFCFFQQPFAVSPSPFSLFLHHSQDVLVLHVTRRTKKKLFSYSKVQNEKWGRTLWFGECIGSVSISLPLPRNPAFSARNPILRVIHLSFHAKSSLHALRPQFFLLLLLEKRRMKKRSEMHVYWHKILWRRLFSSTRRGDVQYELNHHT